MASRGQPRILALLVTALVLSGACGPGGVSLCPPAGPWPQPPGCGGTAPLQLPGGLGAPGAGPSGATAAAAAPTSYTALVQPRYPGPRSAFVFPPSCDMIPDPIGKVQCEDYQKGAMLFWKEDACAAMPLDAGKQACAAERETLRKLGAANAAKMRKDDPGWWKAPYLNTYVYGDTRLRTEELGPTTRIWAMGAMNGWRDDEIFFSHAAGVRTIPSHSFGYVGGADLDGMRFFLMKDEGIVLRGPDDLKRPEYLRIKNDLAYLQQHSKIYQSIAAAEAKDFDGDTPQDKLFGVVTAIMMDATVPAYQDFLIRWYEDQIDADADGIMIDDLVGKNPNHSFNPDTLRRFAAWLRAERPDALARAGVADVASFDYRLYLRGRGYTKATIDDLVGPGIGATERWREIPLMVEFRAFLTAENQRALTEIVRAVRAYAASKGRTDLVITGNSGELSPAGSFTVPLFDFLTFEHSYAQNDDVMRYQSVVPLTELGTAKGRPATNEIVAGVSAHWLKYARLPASLRYDLIRLQVMESAAAHGANHYVRYTTIPERTEKTTEAQGYLALEDRTDLAEIKKAFGFLQRHRDTYRDIATTTARIALVYDNDEVIREWRDRFTADHHGAVWEAGRALFARNLEFDVVSWDQLAAGSYDAVFVPPTATLAPAQTARIAALRGAGKKVYALWRASSGATYDGTVSGDATAAAALAAVRPPTLPDGVRSIRYTNAKGDVLLNLLNEDYAADGFRVKRAVKLDPALFAGAASVRYATLEHPELTPLDPKDPTVPELTTYALVVATR